MHWYATSRRELIVHSIVWQLMFQTSTLSWSQSPSKRKINLNVFLSTNRGLSCVLLARRGQTWPRNPEAKTARVSMLVFKQAQSARRVAAQQPREWGWELPPPGRRGSWLSWSQAGWRPCNRQKALTAFSEFSKCPTGKETQKTSISSIKKGKISTYQKEEGLCSRIWDA